VIGQQVGNYKVISQIGAGGMGEVFLAEHVTIGTRVAIKVLQAQISKDQEQVNRFFNEAKAVSKVRHAGPVKIFDCGYHSDQSGQRVAYLAMEFLEGESLATRIKRLGTLPGEQVADIGRQIAGVLDAVHTAGITHRDLKPDNIFLCPDHELPSGERVKVLDFGIAKLTGTMAGPQTKGTMGTPAYMAPEQWNNASSVDGKADTYSLGCVMFEMAVGRPPFPSQSIGEACNHHLNSKPPRASEIMRSVPPEFDTLLDRMLAKTVDLRPTVKEVARAFDTLRSSGATQRWQAAAVAGVAATMAPNSSPSIGLGSQPGSGQYGSQPGALSGQYGSQPGPLSGQHGSQPGPLSGSHGSQPNLPGHIPGLQNPLSQSYPAQHPGPSASYPVQHGTPVPQHHTPQHHTPQHHTPQHHAPYPPPPGTYPPAPGTYPPPPSTYPPPPGTYPPGTHPPGPGTQPPAKSGGKGLIIGLGALVVIGGGVAVAVVATSGGSDEPAPKREQLDGKKALLDPSSGGIAGGDIAGGGSAKTGDDKGDKPGGGSAKSLIAGGSAEKAVDKPGLSKREQIIAKNPFVDSHGVRVLSSQITAAEYELVMGKLPDGIVKSPDPEAPVASLTQQEAAAFCAAIDARLPTSDEWSKSAKGAWGIAVDATAGPLQEWTSTIQDELVVVRGGHAAMAQAALDKAARSKPPYFLQKDPSGTDRKISSSPTIGFRCVDGTDGKKAEATTAPPKVGLFDGSKNRKVIENVIGSDKLDNALGKFGGTGGSGGGATSSRSGGNVATGAPTATGSLDRSVIQRGVKANMPRIRYCYERELAKDASLQGKVTVKFTIGPSGAVQSAEANGLNPVVSNCVATVVKSMRFPAPQGGGIVTINYPFVFSPQ
jgi:serine/threonine protein kinase